MRIVLASTLVALATSLAACGGSSTDHQSPDFLFDTSRSDVAVFQAPDGAPLGLVNTTFGVTWDYKLGYSRFGTDNQVMWGPVKSFPEAELQSIAPDGVESAEDALTSRAGSTLGGGTVSTTVCTCCYWYKDGSGCGCYECR